MGPSTTGHEKGSLKLLWEPRELPSRGPRPVLNLDRIAGAAIAVADADGLAAVSMQRVAGDLNFTKMALYRHVQGKAELIAVMIEAAVGEPPYLHDTAGGWRPKLEEWARHLWTVWQRHPWLPTVTVGNRIMGPREIAWTECAVGALDGTGLDGHERMDAVVVLSGHIRNTQSASTAGTQPWWTPSGSALKGLLEENADRFPSLTTAIAAVGAGSSTDHGKQFGLERILDGLALLIAERTP